jgi:hypothetical protein
LHIQCPWRLEGPDGIVTGSSDFYCVAKTGDLIDFDNEKYEEYGENLQDEKMKELMKNCDPGTHACINATDLLVVDSVDGDSFGGGMIGLSGGYRLVLFPSGSIGEDWRFFASESDEEYFVISGSKIECE